MSENRKRILELLANGKISVDEASKLLSALGDEGAPRTDTTVPPVNKMKYLRVTVDALKSQHPDGPEKVNIRVPVALIRAGMKFSSLIPKEASEQVDKALCEKGITINLKTLKEEDLETLLEALTDLEVEIDDGKGHVTIHAE